MSTHSADAAANGVKNEEANRNLASIRPSFIVKDLQTSITYYRERLTGTNGPSGRAHLQHGP
jgi:hypothetical protein